MFCNVSDCNCMNCYLICVIFAVCLVDPSKRNVSSNPYLTERRDQEGKEGAIKMKRVRFYYACFYAAVKLSLLNLRKKKS